MTLPLQCTSPRLRPEALSCLPGVLSGEAVHPQSPLSTGMSTCSQHMAKLLFHSPPRCSLSVKVQRLPANLCGQSLGAYSELWPSSEQTGHLCGARASPARNGSVRHCLLVLGAVCSLRAHFTETPSLHVTWGVEGWSGKERASVCIWVPSG